MKVPKIGRLLSRLGRALRRKQDGEDPYARVPVPVKKGPGGLRAAVELEEPRD